MHKEEKRITAKPNELLFIRIRAVAIRESSLDVSPYMSRAITTNCPGSAW
jgi:hypothetical protein